MTNPKPLPVEIISQQSQLGSAVRDLAGSNVLALDTESNSRHYYPEQFCLFQIASFTKVYIIDTIALPDISPLKDVLEDVSIEKVIHSADYDIRSLDRHSGLRIHGIFDTSIAARFIGAPRLGLDTVIKDMLGIDIDKSKTLQRSDWGRRPLSREALQYAAGDVRHLVALQESLEQRLQTLGRASWVAEECDRLEEVRYNPPDSETAFLSVKGSKDLDGRQLAVLRSLYLYREEEAVHLHRPPFFVMPDPALVFMATNPQTDLSDVPGLGPNGVKRFGPGLKQARHNGTLSPRVVRPRPAKFIHYTEEQSQRLVKLKEWRIALGASLSLDPSLLWPLQSLERLARDPGSFSTELPHESIRNWQREVVAASLRDYLKSVE